MKLYLWLVLSRKFMLADATQENKTNIDFRVVISHFAKLSLVNYVVKIIQCY